MNKGCYTALATPMQSDQQVDWQAWQDLYDWQISHVDGLVLLGSTAEAMTLGNEEAERMLAYIQEGVSKPVIVGIGDASTQRVIEKAERFALFHHHAYLVVVPYYLRPTQAGLLSHFSHVADHVAKPVILYNVPSRTACQLDVNTVIELAKHPNIIGLKDADADPRRCQQIRQGVPADFLLWSGDDSGTQQYIASGGDGVISVVSNVQPQMMSKLCNCWLNGQDQPKLSQELRAWLMACETAPNPMAVKWLLAQMNYGSGECRSPLMKVDKDAQVRIQGLITMRTA